MENYNKELENKLIQLVKEKEKADKRLLSAEIVIGLVATLTLFTLVFLAAFLEMSVGLKIFLIVLGFVMFLAGCFYAVHIEQVAGYYACKECGHRYVPTHKAVVMAPHMGRTRKMQCPACGKKSWQKKVISKD